MNKKVKLALTMVAAAAMFGCAQNRSEPDRAPSESGASIMQVGYGMYAKYVTCPLSGCPRPTPKTIAGAPEATAAAQPAAPVVEMVATKAVEPAPEPAKVEAPAVVQPVAAQAQKAEPAVEPAPAPVPAPAPEPAKVEPIAEPASAAVVEKTALADGQQRIYVNFPVRSARLSDEAKEQLDRLVPQVLGAERIVIKGRTDQRGDTDTNDRLAFRRAMAVYDHLRRAAKAGNKPFKLLAKGACCYIARNDTEEGRAANRRAEIDFVVTPLQASATTNRRASSKASSS